MIYWITYFSLCTCFFIAAIKYLLSDGDDVTIKDILIGIFICYTPAVNVLALIKFLDELKIFDTIVIKAKNIDNEQE